MCIIAFTEELTSSANLRVTPSKEPLFTRKLDILEVIEGRTARFDCKVSGSPAPRVTWMHFGKNLSVVFDILCVWFSRQLTAPNSSETMCCFFITLTFFQRHEWRRVIMFASFKRGVVTHLSSPTLAATQKASTLQSLKIFMERLNVPLSSTCKNPELPSLLTCKRSHSYGKHLYEPLCHFKGFE